MRWNIHNLGLFIFFYRLSSPRAQVAGRFNPPHLVFGGGRGLVDPIIKKIAINWKTVRDREKVTRDHLWETGVVLSEFAVILVAMATRMGETLHRSPKMWNIVITRERCEIRQKLVLVLIANRCWAFRIHRYFARRVNVGGRNTTPLSIKQYI